MEVELLTLMANPDMVASTGDVVDLPKDQAEHLIDTGQAVAAEPSGKEPEGSGSDEEAAGGDEEQNEDLRARIADEMEQSGGWFDHDLLDEKVQGQENAIDAVIDKMTEEE